MKCRKDTDHKKVSLHVCAVSEADQTSYMHAHMHAHAYAHTYAQMLLCDACDRECHTYCQYPVLWAIPRGKWLCPVCKEVS